ncbi:MAG: hypothetical protein A2252_04775 [Elusimicrobia bacterium RIFOXYA2_FULL_39_19]|nr:MAG: hypothetical protein A2252_04775 [Elusimicrobia bacterium RIFOXYA2_FULL_39_19]
MRKNTKTTNVKSDLFFIKEALKEAKKSLKKSEVPIGSVIVNKGKIISKAHNLMETLNDATAHAEIIAIRKASKKTNNWRLNNSIIYSTIEPCKMCYSVIEKSRIERVVYGCASLENNFVKPQAVNSQIINSPELEKVCRNIIQDFFIQTRTKGVEMTVKTKKSSKEKRNADRRKGSDKRWIGGNSPSFDRRKSDRRMGERREKK